MTSKPVIVPPSGRSPNDVLLVGEAPGWEEMRSRRPFVGPSGEEQEWYLSRHRLSARLWRVTNVIQEWTHGNPDPTPEQIARWTPVLMREVYTCAPKLIVACGRFAARWFLGDSAEMEVVHGRPYQAGAFDSSRADRGCGAVIVPVYHPAFGLRDKKGENRSIIDWDYCQVSIVLDRIKRGKLISYVHDDCAGKETYLDCTGSDLRDLIIPGQYDNMDIIGIDTEGTEEEPFSMQVSHAPGHGYTLRYSQPDFAVGIEYLQSLVNDGVTFVEHSTYEMTTTLPAMKPYLDIGPTVADSMLNLYLLRTEPQGLKPAALRRCGMIMKSHEDTIDVLGAQRQIEYLERVVADNWPKVSYTEYENDGRWITHNPHSISKRAAGILRDYRAGKRDKKGNPVNLERRWKQVEKVLRTPVESKYGQLPHGSMKALWDVDPESALYYMCRDPDAHRRVYIDTLQELRRQGLESLMHRRRKIIPILARYQRNGLWASRKHFMDLDTYCISNMDRIRESMQDQFNGGKRFNPKSPDQTAGILLANGIEGAERTKTGKMSTSKNSIEGMRTDSELVGKLIDWREIEHVRAAFCLPLLGRAPFIDSSTDDDTDDDTEDDTADELIADDSCADLYRIRCSLLNTRTTSSRWAAKNPNFLAMPTSTDIGRMIRKGFKARPGKVLIACDQSQIEMRILASESNCKFLVDAFLAGQDIHCAMASRIFRIALDQVDKNKHRKPAKTVNYGEVYGIGAHGMSVQLRKLGLKGWDEDACQDLIDKWMEICWEVRDFIAGTAKNLRAQSKPLSLIVVRDRWGMPRLLPGITHPRKSIANECARQAVNHKIQAFAAGAIMEAMVWLERELEDIRADRHYVMSPVIESCVEGELMVHDELVYESDEDIAPAVKSLMIEALTEHCGIELSVPILADGSISDNWGDLK